MQYLCHRLSKSAQSALEELDHVECAIVTKLVERDCLRARNSPKHKITCVPRGARMLTIVWRKPGDVHAGRPVIYWDAAFEQARTDQPEAFWKGFAHHLAATVAVAALSGIVGFVWKYYDHLLRLYY